jgi:CheY-like chemotaxis protein
MPCICLFHWKESEIAERSARLKNIGYDVIGIWDGNGALKKVRESAPIAIIVDLTRLPSHGKSVAIMLRQSKSTRPIPLVFIEGDPAKTDTIANMFPDASFTTWSRIKEDLKKAIVQNPVEPVVPESESGFGSGVPLVRKLMIKPDSVLGLVKAPPGFDRTLGELPDRVTIRQAAAKNCDTIIWFCRSERELHAHLPKMSTTLGPSAGLWIAWPKQASKVKTDLTQTKVRRAGLDIGLVDHKICAIDTTWSGLRFVHRKK